MVRTLDQLELSQRKYVKDAACGSKNPRLFDTDRHKGESEARMADRIVRAKAVCNTCPVVAECFADARANHYEHGIWGGLTPLERGIIPRKRSGRRNRAKV